MAVALEDRYYATQAATARAVTAALAALWTGQMTGSDFDAGWALIATQAVATVTTGQVRAAAVPALYLERVLDDAGETPTGDALSPIAFAGVTAEGDLLAPVLQSAVVVAKQAVAAGLSTPAALTRGMARLTLLGASQTQDAGRGAMQSAMLLEPKVSGYTRYVRTPACGRCIVQAGKFFRLNAGFLRHPRCDCQHKPVIGRQRQPNVDQDPRELFKAMTTAEQAKAFTRDGATAIADGADIGQVVNARSGMQSAGDLVTTSGKRAPGTARRLSPQGVARVAGDDRAKYRELLAANGYL